MRKIWIVMILTFLSSFAFAQETKEVEVIAPKEYQQQIAKKNVQLIDVRTPEEYRRGHIKGAKNINFLDEGFLSEFEALDKEKSVFIYCRSGNRSAKASKKLTEAGFKHIIDLEGGYKAWKSSVEK